DAHPLCSAYLRACAELGYKIVDDLNGPEHEAVGLYPITTRNGVRASAATAYLHPARRRANLHVLTDAHAVRVLCEGARAVAVEYRRGGDLHLVRGRREIILSAGAVNSPQLLQLSGIGPAALLKDHGIAVVKDTPAVGQNLQDHLGVDYL